LSDVIIARRYARALYNLAVERQQVAQVEEELAGVLAIAEESQDFRRFWHDKKLGPAIKKEVLNNILANHVSESILHFLFMVVDKRREKLLALMRRELRFFINQAAGVLEGEADSAVPLSREEIAGLEASLRALANQKVRLTNLVVPELLGGVRIRLGDWIIDSSVRQRLAALKQKLLEADLSQIGVS